MIASGEIGLSQFLLAYGVNLRPFYPLVNSLVVHSSVSSELVNNQVLILIVSIKLCLLGVVF